MSFSTVLEKYRADAFSNRDLGDKFERLIQAFFRTYQPYDGRFQNIWLWSEFPYRLEFGLGQDIGIDLVCQTVENEYWAVQCKCFKENTAISKEDVDSFLSASGKKFRAADGNFFSFSYRLWVSTTNKWSSHAEAALQNQTPPVLRLNLSDLESAPVDWDKLDAGSFGKEARAGKKVARPHQTEAISAVHEYFQQEDRGKLIMACGTGKTYTALKIAEMETGGNGLILVFVPSIALLSQTLREWCADAEYPIRPLCICSDATVSRRSKSSSSDSFDQLGTVDLAFPASTDPERILHNLSCLPSDGLTVFFSTYQSIAVVHDVQEQLKRAFDLIVCDEAHRTTGVTLAGEDSSAFVKVHDNAYLSAKKRLYMTATPRLYSESSKKKAEENDAVLCSMDDERLYGKEIYRLGFGRAVADGLLSDYKVLVLTLSEKDISPSVQRLVRNPDGSLNADDAARLIGCINALSKRIIGDDGHLQSADPQPMKRAVAFCQKISASKSIRDSLNAVSAQYASDLSGQPLVRVSSRHIDGAMSATQRDGLLQWLKEDSDECRVLTNVRCLSEGVDVPSLDAVMFLSTRNSQVDVVQSVGRVMRRAEGKKYGYIIIPVVVPPDQPPEKVLDHGNAFQVVWSVLNALRAHDDRFNATINKIGLNQGHPDGPGGVIVGGASPIDDENEGSALSSAQRASIQTRLLEDFEHLQDTVYARMVMKVGDRQYWEHWAGKVADIASAQISRIRELVKDTDVMEVFCEFVTSLQASINPSIDEDQAIEMLSQHMITKPVFEAIFEDSSFVSHNPVSQSMQKMIRILEENGFEKDTADLAKFYRSVQDTCRGLDNAAARQSVIVRLYDNFFRTAFPKMVEQLGITYTPVEVVDFILHSVDEVLKEEFGRGLTDENVNILDPFTGTGTFITRLLESGLIDQTDLQRKYQNEIHANEIVLLAYYIAAINIENAYHARLQNETSYRQFPGICLTDTFQMMEWDKREHVASEFFPLTSEKIDEQKAKPITVIVGNPPYSAGQRSANDNAQNQEYPKLEERIAKTYVQDSAAVNKNSLYDSYIKAFRWATERLDKTGGGIIGFVSNGGWLDGNAMDGFRKHLERDFSSIYVLNLRGNQRTSGELSRKEGGKIFGSGSRATVAITLLVKKPAHEQNTLHKAVIRYYDIGDYLTREQKLGKLKEFQSVCSPALKWSIIQPNDEGDWINQRNQVFGTYTPIGDKKGEEAEKAVFLPNYSRGLETDRDAWCYNSSKSGLEENLKRSIEFYNSQVDEFKQAKSTTPSLKAEDFVKYDSTKFSWSSHAMVDINRLKRFSFSDESIRFALYRPFFKQYAYFNREMNQTVSHLPSFFPTRDAQNLVICVPGIGERREFSALITDVVPDLHLIGASQCFPLYSYESDAPAGRKESKTTSASQMTLSRNEPQEITYTRKDGVSDFILHEAQTRYADPTITKEDIFYYVYGLLHSREYRATFSADLKKVLARIPLVERKEDFAVFSRSGRELADLHLHYEAVEPYPGVEVTGAESQNFKVQKMRFKSKEDKSIIFYNSFITVFHIPAKAYEYVVNGKSAIEWIMERYQVTIDKDSGIKNDPNDWSDESGNPRYILDLLLSVITVSMKTMDIVESLPRFEC